MERNIAYPATHLNLVHLPLDSEDLLLRVSSCGQISRIVEILNALSMDDVAHICPDVFDAVLENIVACQDICGPLAAASAVYVLLNIAGMKISSSCFGAAISEFSNHLEVESMGATIGSLLESRMISVSLLMHGPYDDASQFFTDV